MENKIFKTLIKADHKLGGNQYIEGRISGLMEAICHENPGKDILYGKGKNELGMIHMTKTSEERYDKFIEIVEQEYPGLCVFNYEESK